MPGKKGKVAVTAHQCGWCWGDIGGCLNAQEAVEGIKDFAEYTLIDTSSSPCLPDKLYLDQILYKPDGPPANVEEIRDSIIKLYRAKNGHKDSKDVMVDNKY